MTDLQLEISWWRGEEIELRERAEFERADEARQFADALQKGSLTVGDLFNECRKEWLFVHSPRGWDLRTP